MPGVSGFDILTQARALPKFKYLPIIIMTSASGTDTKLRALALGATDFLSKPLDKSELTLRVRNTLAAKAYQDQLAYYDPLTHLPNKQLFLERLDWSLKEAKRYSENLALMNISIDNLSKVNASIGPSAGDEVLQILANRMLRAIRSVDALSRSINDTEDSSLSLFRTEGSTFTLLLDRIHGEKSAAVVAERLIEAIRRPMQIDNTDIYITASVGIAMFPAEGDDCPSLMRLASGAKDYARQKGGNNFQFSSGHINTIYSSRLKMENRLRKAINKEELTLHYQPKVDLQTGAVRGVEALLRWNSEHGMVPPADFIPLAEETGLINAIGEWTLFEACSRTTKWIQSGRRPVEMCVNVSARQFTSPNFLSIVKHAINRTGIDPRLLTLELTESLLIDNIMEKITLLKSLKDMGIKLSIDDFGTGYSSFSYLRKLPVDELKIDKSFIDDLTENSDSQAIVSSVIFLAHRLEMKTVAEGVETEKQMTILEKEACDQYQGFLFSKPLPTSEVVHLLPRQ
ncbi:MAG: EAL domain-containing protein [Nitrospiraceae bacterium]|nr:MAG: EAL domain-containing protein [Nitrospiraceae bacterium]